MLRFSILLFAGDIISNNLAHVVVMPRYVTVPFGQRCQLNGFLNSASWDGSVKMWDGKQPNPIWQQNVGAKVRVMC